MTQRSEFDRSEWGSHNHSIWSRSRGASAASDAAGRRGRGPVKRRERSPAAAVRRALVRAVGGRGLGSRGDRGRRGAPGVRVAATLRVARRCALLIRTSSPRAISPGIVAGLGHGHYGDMARLGRAAAIRVGSASAMTGASRRGTAGSPAARERWRERSSVGHGTGGTWRHGGSDRRAMARMRPRMDGAAGARCGSSGAAKRRGGTLFLKRHATVGESVHAVEHRWFIRG